MDTRGDKIIKINVIEDHNQVINIWKLLFDKRSPRDTEYCKVYFKEK